VKTTAAKIEPHRYGARTDRYYRRLFAVIRAYLDDLNAGWFVFRLGLSCSVCGFRNDHCPSWGG